MTVGQASNEARRAKRYASIRYALVIIDTLYSLVLLFLFQSSGGSKTLTQWISHLVKNRHLIAPTYLLVVYLGYSLLDFPLNFYRSFILEHRFSLSRQKLSDWFRDELKGGIIVYGILLILLEAFYYTLQHYPHTWWLAVGLFWISFSLVLAKLVPVALIPLFFKYHRLSDQALREEIIKLAGRMGVAFMDVFEIDLSKKSLKGNAAFVGVGSTRRVILADTLKDKYSIEEIKVILAHEFAHYKLKHLIKLILFNSAIIIAFLYLIFKTSRYVLQIFGLFSLSEAAGLPVVAMYWAVFGMITQPIQNYLSRRMEREADLMALQKTGSREAFISMMEKLAAQNLADRSPHPLIKLFFFDHPPLEERIALAHSFL